jgi:hypothetical protein
MRYLLLAIAIIPLIPSVASAQSWQDWAKQNPTYPAPNTTNPYPAPNTTNQPRRAWRPEAVNEFIRGCMSTPRTPPKEYCTCAAQQAQIHYTEEQVANIGNQISDNGTLPSSFLDKVVTPCVHLGAQ